MEAVYFILLIGALGAQFFYFRAYIRKAAGRPESLEAVRKEVDALITELNQNADRNLTVMEQRLGELQKAVAEADRRILVLKKEEEKKQSSVQVYSHLQKSRTVTVSEAAAEPGPPPGQQAVPMQPLPASPPVQAEIPAASPPAALTAPEKPVQQPSTAQRVDLLAKEGLDPPGIARSLGITLAEVELILTLRRNKG